MHTHAASMNAQLDHEISTLKRELAQMEAEVEERRSKIPLHKAKIELLEKTKADNLAADAAAAAEPK